jgi:hypothetical protein
MFRTWPGQSIGSGGPSERSSPGKGAMSEEEVEALAAAKKNLQEVDEPVVAGL